MSTRVPRWASLVLLPLLAGALLVMHGLDSRAAAHPTPAVGSGSVEGHHHDRTSSGDHAHCVECVATHVMVACVAIVTVVGAVWEVRRRRAVAHHGARPVMACRWGPPPPWLARPLPPVWLRLSVIRC